LDLFDIQQLHNGSREPIHLRVPKPLGTDIFAVDVAFVQYQAAVAHFGPLKHDEKRTVWRDDPRRGDIAFATVIQNDDFDLGRRPHRHIYTPTA